MFSKRLLPIMLVCLLIFVAGCSSKTAATGDNEQKDATSTADTSDNTKQSVLPNGAPDMTGKVKTIEDNKLTVYKVNMQNNNRPPENKQDGNISPNERPKPQEQTENSGQAPKTREEMFQVTDETVSLIISADTHIVEGFGRNSNSNETTQLSIGDIKTGDMLGLWLGEKLSDGGQPVNFVQIMGPNR